MRYSHFGPRPDFSSHQDIDACPRQAHNSLHKSRSVGLPPFKAEGLVQEASMPLPTIQHIVVLMMENRSLDHLFGFRSGVNGLKRNESNLLDPASPESDTNPAFVVNNADPFSSAGRAGSGALGQSNQRAALQYQDSGQRAEAGQQWLCQSVLG